VPILGSGSGVGYMSSEDGGTYILTNDHVVSDASRIVVTDSTGERYEAQFVGSDPNTDIAVVLVDADLPVIDIGDSEDLVMGQLAIAIGSPFGLQQSVTAGVISALDRSLPDSSVEEGVYPLVDVIQTDASINPGNSGGALLDRQGRLIGINTAIFSDTGVNEGIAFAVPVNTAVRVADELIETGDVQLPFLGVVGTTVTERLAEEEGLPADEGALVIEVTEGTEAEKAGIRPDDIVVGYEGDPVRSMDDLILFVRQSAIGDTVTIELWRDGELMEVEMVVGVKPDEI
jgi:S1-C subfamily serine protease